MWVVEGSSCGPGHSPAAVCPAGRQHPCHQRRELLYLYIHVPVYIHTCKLVLLLSVLAIYKCSVSIYTGVWRLCLQSYMEVYNDWLWADTCMTGYGRIQVLTCGTRWWCIMTGYGRMVVYMYNDWVWVDDDWVWVRMHCTCINLWYRVVVYNDWIWADTCTCTCINLWYLTGVSTRTFANNLKHYGIPPHLLNYVQGNGC